MSSIQPLIASAFSTYAVSRGAFADRTTGIPQSNGDEESKIGVISGSPASEGVAPTSRTDSTQGTEKTQGTDRQAYDRDAGKPKSASGDVLDLSEAAQTAADTQTEATEQRKTELNEEAEKKVDEHFDDLALTDRKTEASEADEDAIAVQDERSSDTRKAASTSGLSSGESELTPEEQQQLEKLKARDQEVRIHEQAHVAAGGQYVTSGPSYTYQTGPDGQKYAIGGEVGIDVSEVSGDPQATIQKMQTVAAAAMAPAEPSSQDHKVAAEARQKAAQARAELAQQQNEALSGSEEESAESAPTSAAVASDAKTDSSTSSAIELAKQSATAASTNASSASDSNKISVSRQSSAYQAQSSASMTSHQTGSSQFSAFA